MKYIVNAIRILFLALFIFLLANGKVVLWLALFAISLIAALIFGRVYCWYVCPMNKDTRILISGVLQHDYRYSILFLSLCI